MGRIVGAIVKWFISHPAAAGIIRDVVVDEVSKAVARKGAAGG